MRNSKNIIWYQINPNYFEQISLEKGWSSESDQISFFGLVKKNLMRIQKLGCNGIWLMPIYERGMKNRKGFGSPYSIKDYQIDSKWGTDQELRELVKEAKDMGFKFICEYVPNHLAPDATFVLSEKDSIYLDINNQPYHDQDWTDTVKLNHSNPSIQGFTSANLTWLMKTYGFNGFRLDMAHYPLHDAHEPVNFGAGDPDFWDKILSGASMRELNPILLAEVYDDRQHDYKGYGDHFRLIREGMIAYDKKTHDILVRKIRFQPPTFIAQERFYEELFTQAQISHLAGIDIKEGFMPFLRIPSNHDDCPGVRLYGGVDEYITAFSALALLPGHVMVYAGDEYGLKIKPSVTGINYCDEHGNMTESSQIRLISESEQNKINLNLNEILNLRNSETCLRQGAFLVAKLMQGTMLSPDLLAFARYLPRQNEIILVVANLNRIGSKSWSRIEYFYPTFDFPSHEFIWSELLEWICPAAANKGYKVENLRTKETSNIHKLADELWVGVEPLEVQVLKISPV